MNINYSKIIADKRARNYNDMVNESLVEFQRHMNLLVTESDDKIKQVLPTLCKAELGVPFVKYYVRTEAMDDSDISELLKTVPTDDTTIRPALEAALYHKGSMEWLNLDTKYKIACERYHNTCLYESTYADELGMIGYNINTSPEAVYRYSNILRNIEVDGYSSVSKSFPEILKKNTELILGLKVTLSGQVGNMIVSLPVVIARRICNEGNKQQKKDFIKIIDKNLADVKAYINTADSRYYNIYMSYMDNLIYAKDMLKESASISIKESTFSSLEHIADMQPDVVMYEDGVISDPIAELEYLMSDIVFSDDISMENITKLATLQTQIDNMYIVEEGKLIRKAAHRVEKAMTKAATKIRNTGNEIKQDKAAIKKVTSPFTNAITKTLKDFKEMDKKERRRRIVEGDFKSKLFSLLKRSILSVALVTAGYYAGLVPLIITLIATITGLAIDTRLDIKERKKLLHELKTELAIVNEKLEDSRGDEKKENKYQLIRIKKKLEADIERIEFRLKDKVTS